MIRIAGSCLAALALVGLAGCGERRAPEVVRAERIAAAEAACRSAAKAMNELTANVKAKLGTDDASKVMSELQKIPEWKRLEAELNRRSEELAAARRGGD